eukprot:754086-Hanusia_phi.AAC.12
MRSVKQVGAVNIVRKLKKPNGHGHILNLQEQDECFETRYKCFIVENGKREDHNEKHRAHEADQQAHGVPALLTFAAHEVEDVRKEPRRALSAEDTLIPIRATVAAWQLTLSGNTLPLAKPVPERHRYLCHVPLHQDGIGQGRHCEASTAPGSAWYVPCGQPCATEPPGQKNPRGQSRQEVVRFSQRRMTDRAFRARRAGSGAEGGGEGSDRAISACRLAGDGVGAGTAQRALHLAAVDGELSGRTHRARAQQPYVAWLAADHAEGRR